MAFCGIDCLECLAYIASQNDDTTALKDIALRWGQHDKQTYSVEDIRCYGCRSTVLNRHCYVCAIRDCSMEKGLRNCGECSEFICSKLREEWATWHDADPDQARRNLENVNA